MRKHKKLVISIVLTLMAVIGIGSYSHSNVQAKGRIKTIKSSNAKTVKTKYRNHTIRVTKGMSRYIKGYAYYDKHLKKVEDKGSTYDWSTLPVKSKYSKYVAAKDVCVYHLKHPENVIMWYWDSKFDDADLKLQKKADDRELFRIQMASVRGSGEMAVDSLVAPKNSKYDIKNEDGVKYRPVRYTDVVGNYGVGWVNVYDFKHLYAKGGYYNDVYVITDKVLKYYDTNKAAGKNGLIMVNNKVIHHPHNLPRSKVFCYYKSPNAVYHARGFANEDEFIKKEIKDNQDTLEWLRGDN